MHTLRQQKVEPLAVGVIAAFAAAGVGLGLLWPSLLPWSIAVAGGFVLLVFWALKWDVTLWAWFWIFSYGGLNPPAWHVEITGFFNMTPPRFIFIAGVVTMALHLLWHRHRLRFDRKLLWVMLLLVGYVAINCQIFGWTAASEQVRTAPYFRFMGAFLLPFAMFFLLYNTAVSEKHIRYALLIVTIYGWYAIYVSYLQFIATRFAPAARSLIFPGYLNDPTYGIHYDRARGAFSGAPPQSILMIFLFFTDLYLIRHVKGRYRFALMVQAALVPPTVFFTYLRSAYLGFLLCWILWSLYSRRFRWIKVSLVLLLIGVSVYVFWDRLSSTDRQAGGVAQKSPIYNRIVLAQQTWDMFKKAPLMGVGFGHFVDAKMQLEGDPDDWISADSSVLVQHNIFLNMLAETGLIGLVLTVLALYLLWRESVGLYRKIPPEARGALSRDLVVLFWVFLLAWLNDANFRDPLWDPFSNALLWSFAALIVCLNRQLEPQPLDLPIVGDVSAR
jgi:O-antigen ligase